MSFFLADSKNLSYPHLGVNTALFWFIDGGRNIKAATDGSREN